jgi:hypothetical protein
MSRHSKKFRSADEMGSHFDDHEVTEENSTETTLLVEKRYDPTLTMRIPEEDLERLKEMADERGISTAAMGRMLILEGMRSEATPRATALRLIETIGADEGLRATLRTVLRGEGVKDSRGEKPRQSQGRSRRAAKALCEHVAAILAVLTSSAEPHVDSVVIPDGMPRGSDQPSADQCEVVERAHLEEVAAEDLGTDAGVFYGRN